MNRLFRINGWKQGHYVWKVENMSEIKQAKLWNVQRAIFNFGEIAAGDVPAPELQAARQLLLGPAVLFAQPRDLIRD